MGLATIDRDQTVERSWQARWGIREESARPAMKLTFLGAAGEVTGSCLRVDHEHGAFLVDCGALPGRTRKPTARTAMRWISSCRIDFVLSPAHLDHSGLLPRLGCARLPRDLRHHGYRRSARCDAHGLRPHPGERGRMGVARHALAQPRAGRDMRRYTVEQARTSLLTASSPPTTTRGSRPGAGVRCRFRDAGTSSALRSSRDRRRRAQTHAPAGGLGRYRPADAAGAAGSGTDRSRRLPLRRIHLRQSRPPLLRGDLRGARGGAAAHAGSGRRQWRSSWPSPSGVPRRCSSCSRTSCAPAASAGSTSWSIRPWPPR